MVAGCFDCAQYNNVMAQQQGTDGTHRHLAQREPDVKRTADHLIRAMWSLLKRLSLDWGQIAMEFDSVDWEIRKAVGIDHEGRPCVYHPDHAPSSYTEGSLESGPISADLPEES